MAAKKKAKKGARKAKGASAPQPVPWTDEQFEEGLDALYRAPLSDFIAERKRLAQRLKQSLDERWTAVSKQPKPVVSAWVVNRLALDHAESLDALREAGDAVRELQTGARKAEAEEHRQAAGQRRAALEEALERAEELLDDAGSAIARSTLLRVRSSLESLAIFGTAASPEPPAGRLSQDIEPPGLDVLAQIQLQPGRRKKAAKKSEPAKRKPATAKAPLEAVPARAESSTEPATKAASPAKRRRLESALRLARTAEREATARLKNATRSYEGAERSLVRVRQRLVEAESRFAEAEGERDAATDALEAAREQTRAAERALDSEGAP